MKQTADTAVTRALPWATLGRLPHQPAPPHVRSELQRDLRPGRRLDDTRSGARQAEPVAGGAYLQRRRGQVLERRDRVRRRERERVRHRARHGHQPADRDARAHDQLRKRRGRGGPLQRRGLHLGRRPRRHRIRDLSGHEPEGAAHPLQPADASAVHQHRAVPREPGSAHRDGHRFRLHRARKTAPASWRPSPTWAA